MKLTILVTAVAAVAVAIVAHVDAAVDVRGLNHTQKQRLAHQKDVTESPEATSGNKHRQKL